MLASNDVNNSVHQNNPEIFRSYPKKESNAENKHILIPKFLVYNFFMF